MASTRIIKLYVTPDGRRVGDKDHSTIASDGDNFCRVRDGNVWCQNQLSQGYFICTRYKGHPGPHIAHRSSAEICGIWTDVHPSLAVSDGL